MPKEVIYKEILFDNEEVNSSGLKSGSNIPNTKGLQLHVGWDKQNKVNPTVVIATLQGPMDPDPEDSNLAGDQDGWVVELDRSEINRLIRTLRNARDQAYGKDE